MTELSPESRALLHAAEGGDDPRDDDRARVRAALVARLAVGGAATIAAGKSATAATGASTGAGAAKAGLAIKLGVAIAVTAAAGGGVWLATREPASTREPAASHVAPAPPARPAPEPARVAPEVAPVAPPVEASLPAPAPRPPPERARPVKPATTPAMTAPAPAPAPAADPAALERETAVLRDVRAALRDQEPARALTALARYAHEFPDGVLAEEADALRIDALCARGLVDDATAAATRFVADHPTSIHAARVARGCEGDPP